MLALVLVSLVEAAFYPTYHVTNVVENATAYTAVLQVSDLGSQSMGTSLRFLSFTAYFNADDTLRITITDQNSTRWSPSDFQNTQGATTPLYTLTVIDTPFSFAVVRVADSAVLFNSTSADGSSNFYFADTYLELSSSLPASPNVYGLGERVTAFSLDTNETYYTLWNLAQDCIYDTGKETRGRNMYGHHPFYLEMRNGSAHGVFLHNYNAMDVVFTGQRLVYKVVGGQLDLFFFVGPTPEQVLQQYHSVIGLPSLPPYWALGYNQCRWGYNSLSMLSNVLAGYVANSLPLDVLWSDIDYMYQFEDFTLDASRYQPQAFANFTSALHAQERRFVPIVDAGIANRTYFGYERGLAYNTFVQRDNTTTDPFVGLVWPGKSVWVDFFHPNSSAYWSEMLAEMQQQVNFDGIWLDMNEASSFCDGECGFASNTQPPPSLPYVPGNHSLQDQLLPLRAQHYGGPLYSEFNTHALFATMETKATYDYLAAVTAERPFILSRSSVPGHGVYGNHWLGDNYSLWTQLRYSVAGVFNFQMFGIPIVGADVCGFHNNTTPELCTRWLQLGAFYPFMRNHNDIGSAPQELYALGPEVMANGAAAVRLRYSLHYYLYSTIFTVALQGGSVFKPMFFEFPQETQLYSNQEQFMSGSALLVMPVLYEGATSVTGYLPNSTLWYDFATGEPISSTGWQTFDSPLDTVLVFLRGGYAIPYTNPSGAVTLSDIRQRSVQIKAGLDANKSASGYYYVDDGLSLNTIASKSYSKYIIQIGPVDDAQLEVRIYPEHADYLEAGHLVSDIWIYGLDRSVSKVHGGYAKVVSHLGSVCHLQVSLSATKETRLLVS